MDAFYAQIEQRDFPGKYAGEPIAVGGDPPEGVVKAASYEARPYGVHSAQPAVEADRPWGQTGSARVSSSSLRGWRSTRRSPGASERSSAGTPTLSSRFP
ncbi:hypothetical protein [Salinibacter ruber]|uniref:Y-family DNA polymerase n=1 Tax=Salinibacter ruber TaxID=146919 RepID=UPI0020734DB1